MSFSCEVLLTHLTLLNTKGALLFCIVGPLSPKAPYTPKKIKDICLSVLHDLV